jgi:hypothetical protein
MFSRNFIPRKEIILLSRTKYDFVCLLSIGLLYKAFLDYTIRTFDWFHERLRLKCLLR